MRLTPQQARSLRRMAKAQVVIFGLAALIFGGMCAAGGAAWSAGTVQLHEMPWFATIIVLLLLGVSLAAGLVFGWLAAANVWFIANIPNITVHSYEGVPVKKTFSYRQQTNIGAGGSMLTGSQVTGAWLCHDGKKLAVDLQLFRQIPDTGTFRYDYIHRPGFPGLLTPYLVIDFKAVSGPQPKTGAVTSGKPAVAFDGTSNCQCMTPSNYRAGDYSMANVGIDETNGRFGEVSIATCNFCRKQWLCYQLEYEGFERSGRWYRGEISPEDAGHVRPENAVAMLDRMGWYFAGGSYFESAGSRRSGAPAVDP